MGTGWTAGKEIDVKPKNATLRCHGNWNCFFTVLNKMLSGERGVSLGMLSLAVAVFVAEPAPPKQPLALPLFQEWQNGVCMQESGLPEEDWGNPGREDDPGYSKDDVGKRRWNYTDPNSFEPIIKAQGSGHPFWRRRSYSSQARPLTVLRTVSAYLRWYQQKS